MNENLTSPVVNKDRSVTFNLKNEYAKTVEVSGDFVFGPELHVLDARTPMKKGPGNVWTLTSLPMLPGTYGYMYVVDGLRTLDPLNPLIRRVAEPFRPLGLRMNIVRIEADEPMPWDVFSAIPHGSVVIEKFYSEKLGQVKGCTFYLPPDYKPAKEYPILYLLHGGGNDYLSWIFDEATDNIMDYLIARANWDTLVQERNKALCSQLDDNGIRYVYMSADAGHVAAFWQRSLVDYVSRLSQIL